MNKVRIGFQVLYSTLQVMILTLLLKTENALTGSMASRGVFGYEYLVCDLLAIYFFLVCGVETG